MAKVKDINYLNLEGWMVSRLHLKGDALIAYGIVFTYSQSGEGYYTGGLAFIADWAGCHPDTARRALRKLSEAGLIIEHRGDFNGVPYCYYTANLAPLQDAGVSLQNTGVSSQNATTPSPQNSRGDTRNLQGLNINNNTSKRNESINTNTFNFRQALLDLGVSTEVADAWLQVRRSAKASNSEIAFKGIAREIAKSGYPADDCIRTAVERSWRGFNAEWMGGHRGPTPNPLPRQQEGPFAAAARVMDSINRKYQNIQQYDEQ